MLNIHCLWLNSLSFVFVFYSNKLNYKLFEFLWVYMLDITDGFLALSSVKLYLTWQITKTSVISKASNPRLNLLLARIKLPFSKESSQK